MPTQLAPNRQERRREARHKQQVAKGKIADRATGARRDRQSNAREINRTNIRHKLGVPDDPTALEKVQSVAMKAYKTSRGAWYEFWMLNAEENKEEAMNAMVGLVLAAIAAILLCCYDRYVVGKAASPMKALNISHIPSGLFEE
ncbi:uncharacterized protein AB675_7036 [Cyphellophora attinorum]|uniref:Uncharacterized protein n=1 Tax=Cyphellophora attinorum TaxID=1664694 RepID=A0A0N1HEJ7_9EURO|nr:uncharacterized protein AB675_7036 [Phialophora attinorum]KPI43437.1 hypothetical protein AB675_7036 [Phialophora attinorum]